MTEYIKLWLAKTVADVAVGLVVLLALIVIILVCASVVWIRQALCKHPAIREDRACQAWCVSCHKRLGFIGTVREQRKARRKWQP